MSRRDVHKRIYRRAQDVKDEARCHAEKHGLIPVSELKTDPERELWRLIGFFEGMEEAAYMAANTVEKFDDLP